MPIHRVCNQLLIKLFKSGRAVKLLALHLRVMQSIRAVLVNFYYEWFPFACTCIDHAMIMQVPSRLAN